MLDPGNESNVDNVDDFLNLHRTLPFHAQFLDTCELELDALPDQNNGNGSQWPISG